MYCSGSFGEKFSVFLSRVLPSLFFFVLFFSKLFLFPQRLSRVFSIHAMCFGAPKRIILVVLRRVLILVVLNKLSTPPCLIPFSHPLPPEPNLRFFIIFKISNTSRRKSRKSCSEIGNLFYAEGEMWGEGGGEREADVLA